MESRITGYLIPVYILTFLLQLVTAGMAVFMPPSVLCSLRTGDVLCKIKGCDVTANAGITLLTRDPFPVGLDLHKSLFFNLNKEKQGD